MITYILYFFITFCIRKSSEYGPSDTSTTTSHQGIVLVFATIVLLIIGTLLTIYLRYHKNKIKKDTSHIIESSLFRQSSTQSRFSIHKQHHQRHPSIIITSQFKNAIHNASLIPSASSS
ncbi:unnamed protein product [Cunninghamella blakesleeana]